MGSSVAAEINSSWLLSLISGIVLVCLLALLLWRRLRVRNVERQASGKGASWEKEEIPNEALLFMRVHRNHFDDSGEIDLAAFRNHKDKEKAPSRPGMSTDWEKYSSPKQCRQGGRQTPQNQNYAVIQLPVGRVRRIPLQTVEHDPIYDPPILLNRAHTEVFGEKDEEARLTLRQISSMVLPPVPVVGR